MIKFKEALENVNCNNLEIARSITESRQLLWDVPLHKISVNGWYDFDQNLSGVKKLIYLSTSNTNYVYFISFSKETKYLRLNLPQSPHIFFF